VIHELVLPQEVARGVDDAGCVERGVREHDWEDARAAPIVEPSQEDGDADDGGDERRERSLRPDAERVQWEVLPWLPEYGLTRQDAELLADVFEGSMPASEIRHYRDAIQRPGAARGALNYYRAFMRLGVRDALPRLDPGIPMPESTVSAPTRVVWGEDDDALLTANAEGLDEWVPDIAVTRLADAGHWVQLDAPDRVNDALLAHFE
jgi:pimeloyl-ACP methyl ester carboxylesterase